MSEFFTTGRFWKVWMGIRSIVLMLLLAYATPAWSQKCSSVKPNVNMCFYIDGYPQNATRVRICEGTKIKLINCSTNGNLIQYSFVGDSTKLTPPEPNGDHTYTYTTAGLYTILQQGNYPDPPPGTTQSLYRYRKCDYIEVLPNVAPNFTLDYCANRQVSVTITDLTYASYLINWGDGSPDEAVPAAGTYVHTYPNVNSRIIKVSGQYAGTVPLCGGSLSKTVVPLVNLPVPRIQKLTVQNPTTAELQFDAEAGTAYRIEKRNEANGTYSPVVSIPLGAARLVSQALTGAFGATSVTYRVVATDVCGSPVVPSEEISSVVLSVVASNGENQVNWTSNGVATFLFGELTSSKGASAPVSTQSGTYTDANVRCGDTYCYQLRQLLAGGAVSLSDTFCLKATSTRAPVALEKLEATVADGKVVLTWAPPADAVEYTILRVQPDGQKRVLSRTTNLQYTDADSRLEEEARCYQVLYADPCGNISEPSATVCPIRLTGTEVTGPLAQEGYQLVWAPYTGWQDGTPVYQVEKLDASNQLLEVQEATQTELFFPKDTIHQLVRFRITALGRSQTSVSNVVEIRQPLQLGIPEAFSPNDDGINDRLWVWGLYIRTFRIVIYNRWGEIVYTSNDRSVGWDGKKAGAEPVHNVYTYAITVEDQLGKTTVRQGNVLVLGK